MKRPGVASNCCDLCGSWGPSRNSVSATWCDLKWWLLSSSSTPSVVISRYQSLSVVSQKHHCIHTSGSLFILFLYIYVYICLFLFLKHQDSSVKKHHHLSIRIIYIVIPWTPRIQWRNRPFYVRRNRPFFPYLLQLQNQRLNILTWSF